MPPENAPGAVPEPAADECDPSPRHRAVLVQRLFVEHNQALIGFLLTRVNSEQEARDVAQEAYVRMLELDAPGAVSFLRAYLFRTAANLATDRARQRAARHRLQKTYIEPFVGNMQLPTPERAVGARQELELVRRFMAELPPRCREAFYLHRFREMSVTDVAQHLGVSDRMIRTYLVRALAHCSQRLEAERSQSRRDQVDDERGDQAEETR